LNQKSISDDEAPPLILKTSLFLLISNILYESMRVLFIETIWQPCNGSREQLAVALKHVPQKLKEIGTSNAASYRYQSLIEM